MTLQMSSVEGRCHHCPNWRINIFILFLLSFATEVIYSKFWYANIYKGIEKLAFGNVESLANILLASHQKIKEIFSFNATVKSSVIGILSTCWLTLLDTSVWVPVCSHNTTSTAIHVFQKKLSCCTDQEEVCDQTPTAF